MGEILTLGDMGIVQIRSGKPTAPTMWWDPDREGLSVWAAYAPKGASNQDDSYVDESGNGNNVGIGVAPTWNTAYGWKFNGATQYLTTNFIPANDQSQTILVQFIGPTVGIGCLAGSSNGVGNQFSLVTIGAFPARQYYNGGDTFIIGGCDAANMGIAGNQGYLNGLPDGGSISAWTGSTTYPVWIGASNTMGVMGVPTDAYIQSMALYDTALTAGQMAAVAVAMAAL